MGHGREFYFPFGGRGLGEWGGVGGLTTVCAPGDTGGDREKP